MSRVLITGATGFIGGRLARELSGAGAQTRCLVRDRARAEALERAGCELHVGDVLRPETLAGAGEGVDVAYYLVHSMGRGAGAGFADRDRDAARAFARMARAEGVGRVVYLGGLGGEGESASPHLRSRHETALILRDEGPPLTYFRAAMVVGPKSEGYQTLVHLVRRLPVMIAPAWLKTRTQPIAIDDVIAYLRRAPEVGASAGREVQIGGPDLLAYGEMLDRVADAMGRRRPVKLPVPLLSPRLSSLWIGLVTPVDADVARPLIEGLSTETVVTDPSGAEPFGIDPMGFDAALRAALADDRGAA
jgi:uncharacterized protein YbjT (DUF2867 family)